MTSITFKATLGTIQYDPKKGEAKIQLIGHSHVPLDKLSYLSPDGEPVSVTLESDQTKIETFSLDIPEGIAELQIVEKEKESVKWGTRDEKLQETHEPEPSGQIADEFAEDLDGKEQ